MSVKKELTTRKEFIPENDYQYKARETKKGVCSRKEVYATEQVAWAASAKVSKRDGTLTEPYKCKFCHKYHLSKRSSIEHRGGKVMNLPKEFKGRRVLFDELGPYSEVELACEKCGGTETGIQRISVVDGQYTRFQGIFVDESVLKRTKRGAKTFVHAKGCPVRIIEEAGPVELQPEPEELAEESVKERAESKQALSFAKFDLEVLLDITTMVDPRNSSVSDGAARGMAYALLRQITEALMK